MEKHLVRKLAAFAFIGLLALPLFAQGLARADGRLDSAIGQAQAVTAAHGMVVAQEAMAARIGADILQKGGNAVDAAVAVGFALAVTYPRAGNIGGGGFMVIHRAGAAGGGDTTIDYRETAPAAITKNPSSTRRAMPIRKNPATPRSPSACRARSRGWRWRRKNTARAVSRWPI